MYEISVLKTRTRTGPNPFTTRLSYNAEHGVRAACWCLSYAKWCIMVPSTYAGLIMARSPVASDRKSVRTSVTLPEDALFQVQALADANHVSSAWVIRMAVQRFLDEHHGQLELPLRLSSKQGFDINE